MKEKKTLKQNPNYPENFWPRIIFLLFMGVFIYWVMTSSNAGEILRAYLINPIEKKLGSF